MLSEYWNRFQVPLIVWIESSLGNDLSEKEKEFVRILDLLRLEKYVRGPYAKHMGRRESDRRSILRAFVAKTFFNYSTTEMLIEALRSQNTLRRLCGFETKKDVPSASTFSRAYAEFSVDNLGDRIHKAMVSQCITGPVENISRDSTRIDAREKPLLKVVKLKEETKVEGILELVESETHTEPGEVESPALQPKYKRGRPRKGEVRPLKEETRLKQQLGETPEQSLEQLSYVCNYSRKANSKGHKETWVGWKAHIDYADGTLPVNVVTTSASVHDSQLAIPMMRITATRVQSTYELMDAAYDASAIRQACEELRRVSIIDSNRRTGPEQKMDPDMKQRYKARSTAERGNSRLKDEYGFRSLRVRGHAKVHMHLMFGILVLFADQLFKIHRC